MRSIKELGIFLLNYWPAISLKTMEEYQIKYAVEEIEKLYGITINDFVLAVLYVFGIYIHLNGIELPIEIENTIKHAVPNLIKGTYAIEFVDHDPLRSNTPAQYNTLSAEIIVDKSLLSNESVGTRYDALNHELAHGFHWRTMSYEDQEEFLDLSGDMIAVVKENPVYYAGNVVGIRMRTLLRADMIRYGQTSVQEDFATLATQLMSNPIDCLEKAIMQKKAGKSFLYDKISFILRHLFVYVKDGKRFLRLYRGFCSLQALKIDSNIRGESQFPSLEEILKNALRENESDRGYTIVYTPK